MMMWVCLSMELVFHLTMTMFILVVLVFMAMVLWLGFTMTSWSLSSTFSFFNCSLDRLSLDTQKLVFEVCLPAANHVRLALCCRCFGFSGVSSFKLGNLQDSLRISDDSHINNVHLLVSSETVDRQDVKPDVAGVWRNGADKDFIVKANHWSDASQENLFIVIWDLYSLQMLKWSWLKDFQTVDSQCVWLSLTGFDIKDLFVLGLTSCKTLQLCFGEKTYQCVIDLLVCFNTASFCLT